MAHDIIWMIAGLVLLVKGADYFIEASARLAKKLGVSNFMIGLTVVAVGTSLPELASAVIASFNNYPGIIIGNIVGSNIANICLILGIAAFLRTVYTKKSAYARDSYFMVLSAILLLYFALDGRITRIEGIILLAVYLTYLLFLYKTSGRNSHHHFRDYISFLFNFEYLTTIKSAVIRNAIKKKDAPVDQKTLVLFRESITADILIILISLGAVFFGAKYFINGAVWLAGFLGLSTVFIGLTAVTFGTVLPELAVSIKGVTKGYGGIAIGNIIGSNITNIFLILGVASVIRPVPLAEMSVLYLIPILLFITLLFVYLIKSRHKITRTSGIILLLVYFAFIAFAFFNSLF